jgi:hypothetical protein
MSPVAGVPTPDDHIVPPPLCPLTHLRAAARSRRAGVPRCLLTFTLLFTLYSSLFPAGPSPIQHISTPFDTFQACPPWPASRRRTITLSLCRPFVFVPSPSDSAFRLPPSAFPEFTLSPPPAPHATKHYKLLQFSDMPRWRENSRVPARRESVEQEKKRARLAVQPLDSSHHLISCSPARTEPSRSALTHRPMRRFEAL